MDRLVRMDVDQFVAAMRPEMERVMRQVAEAVNNAPDGRVISGSEIAVRDALGELRQKAFETAVQMRVDATEGAFSPSQGRERQEQAEQGT